MLKNGAVFVLCVVVLFTSSNGLTLLSFKLIHRFSDEAKSLPISRNRNGQLWPEKNTFNYLHLLISNDLKRQKMKLNTQNQLLFPSQGSRTYFFANDLDWLHYTWIEIGTPKVSFLVALDAGSDLLWVPCDCIQCAPLSSAFYSSLDKDLNEFKPSLSSSSRHISCNHQLCELGSHCKDLEDDPCPYIANYADPGNTSSSGFLVQDNLHLDSVADRKKIQASVVLGCGRKQTGGFLDGAAPDGVLGLGPGNISVPSLLAKSGLIQKSFSLCFDVNGSGTILFGDQGHASQKSTPFLPLQGKYDAYLVEVESYCVGNSCLKQSGFKALVDSGSSFTYLPADVYDKIVSEFDKHVNVQRISSEGGPWNYCYNASSKQLESIPVMRLRFHMNQSLLIHNSTYHVPQNQEYTVFCLTLQPIDYTYGIIGQDYMAGYHVVFDMENLKMGWSSSNCQDISHETENLTPPSGDRSLNPLPTNEQQSVPRKHAVAPAVAGRTSSKPSAASQVLISYLHYVMSILVLLQLMYHSVLPI